MKARSVADAGGYGNYRAGDHAAYRAWQRSFHPGAHNDYPRFHQPRSVTHETMNAGDADIADRIDIIAHDLGRNLRLLRYRHVARARADDRDASLASHGLLPPKTDGARQREVLRVIQLFGNERGGR